MPTLHVFCNCKHKLLIDLPHSHFSLSAALRQATQTPACLRNEAASPCRHHTHSAAAVAAASLTATQACSNLAPTSTTAAIAPRWLATVPAEDPMSPLIVTSNIKPLHLWTNHYTTTGPTSLPSSPHDFGRIHWSNVKQHK